MLVAPLFLFLLPISFVSLQKLLSVKQMFMRYISHEMRTPLNVACLGIKILRDELERLGLLSLLETAIDTEKSCKTAVDILNDMLLFDKIVSGLMTLEKRLFDHQSAGPFPLTGSARSDDRCPFSG